MTQFPGLVVGASLFVCAAGCGAPCAATAGPPSAYPVSEAGTEARARTILAATLAEYERRMTYVDRGTVTSTIRSSNGRQVQVAYFDTVFVRDYGLRFRYFNEQGNLEVAIWSVGDSTRVLSVGRVRATTLEDAFAGARGITRGVSSLIPAVLLGERRWVGAALVAGIESSCGRCEILAWKHRRGGQEWLTVDEEHNVFRRFESRDLVPSEPEGFVSEVYVVYAPELKGLDRAALIRELSVEPW